MKITCQSCQSKYTVSDEKVQGKTVKIKCRKCGATILVNSGGATTNGGGPAEPDSLPSVNDIGQTFLVNVAEGDQRSMALSDIIAAYNSSAITADTYVWADGMGDWQPLGQVETIVAALNNPAMVAASSPGMADPAMMHAPSPEPMYAAPPEPSAEPSAPRAAARRDPGRKSADLFGAGAGQQAVEEVATSAPLFNGSPPAPHPPGVTAKRDDNSILFSLSALTAKSATSPGASMSSSRSTAKTDDSGLIDLKALAAAPVAASSTAADFMGDSMGLFPLGAPPVAAPAAAPVAVSTPPAAPSKTPIFIGVGIAVVSLAIVGVFFAMRGGGDKAQPADTGQAQVAPPPVATTTEPAPAPPPTATADASATATALAGPKPPPRPYKPGGGVKPTTGGGAPTPAPAPAPAPPKRDKCGCAPGDLMCAMKCSAK